jgi:hypothetical protein
MPAVALHPKANWLREKVRRIAIEPSIRWIDCQSRKDIMNFWEFDPVAGIGIDAGKDRHNPKIWIVRFRDLVSPQYYRGSNLFRLHYQFIMSGDLRAQFDFFMLVCGPLPVTEWATRGPDALQDFSTDASYRGGPPAECVDHVEANLS